MQMLMLGMRAPFRRAQLAVPKTNARGIKAHDGLGDGSSAHSEKEKMKFRLIGGTDYAEGKCEGRQENGFLFHNLKMALLSASLVFR
jgi:hypothetical protein